MPKPSWTPEEIKHLHAVQDDYTNGSKDDRKVILKRVCDTLAALRTKVLTPEETKVVCVHNCPNIYQHSVWHRELRSICAVGLEGYRNVPSSNT